MTDIQGPDAPENNDAPADGEFPSTLELLGVVVLLRQLIAVSPLSVYELVAACRDSDHVLYGDAGVHLKSYRLIESVDEQGHAVIDDTIRRAVPGILEVDDDNQPRIIAAFAF